MGCGKTYPLAMGPNETLLPMGAVGGVPLAMARYSGVMPANSLIELDVLASGVCACITSVSSSLDNVVLVGEVCPGKKFNGMTNWGCVAGVADELGGTETTGGETCDDDV